MNSRYRDTDKVRRVIPYVKTRRALGRTQRVMRPADKDKDLDRSTLTVGIETSRLAGRQAKKKLTRAMRRRRAQRRDRLVVARGRQKVSQTGGGSERRRPGKIDGIQRRHSLRRTRSTSPDRGRPVTWQARGTAQAGSIVARTTSVITTRVTAAVASAVSMVASPALGVAAVAAVVVIAVFSFIPSWLTNFLFPRPRPARLPS